MAKIEVVDEKPKFKFGKIKVTPPVPVEIKKPKLTLQKGWDRKYEKRYDEIFKKDKKDK